MSNTIFTHEEQQAIESKGFVLRMVCIPGTLISMGMLLLAWPSDHWLVTAGWTVVAAYTLFCWTSCFHETAHQTLTPWRWVDLIVGRLLGTVMHVPYSSYRESHVRHHAYMNRPDDWELWPYSNPSCSLVFRRVFALLDVFAGIVTAPIIYGRIFFHRNSPLKDHALRRTIVWEYAAIVIFWGSIFATLTVTGTWLGFLKVWLVPQMLAAMLQSLRKLTEHLGMSSYDPLLGTRTVVSENWITRICSYANFDIFVHGPHHRHPRLAQNLLRGKMDEYRAANPHVAYPIYTSYLRATAAMLPHFFMNPGIGANTGGQAVPAATGGGPVMNQVTNFVADVVADVSQR